MSGTCLFCGANNANALTKEHINPRWLLGHLGLPTDDQMLQAVASSETNELVGRPRVHSSFNFVHGHVCADCNGGWMCRLEAAAKPILVPLIEGQKPIASLSSDENRIVSKWAAKTAYLHTWAGPLKDPVQIEHLKQLHGDDADPSAEVGVFAMQADYSQPTSYVQTGHWPQLTPNEKANGVDTPQEAYKIALQYRRLYLLVTFWPVPTSVLARLKGMHIRIWANGVPDEEWSYQPPALAGPIGITKTFADWLAVIHAE
jgi:hypothetical protein